MKSIFRTLSDKFCQKNEVKAVSTALNRDRFIRFADKLKCASYNINVKDYSVEDEQISSYHNHIKKTSTD